MHQLARNARPGFGQPAQLCTVCFIASGRPVPATWRTPHSGLQRLSRRCAQYSTDSTVTEPTTSEPEDAGAARAKKNPVKNTARPRSSGANARSSGVSVAGRKTKAATKNAASAAQQARQTQLKLWRETLDVLKKLEAAQGRLAEQAEAATENAAAAVSGGSDDAATKEVTVGGPGKKSKSMKKSSLPTETEKSAAIEASKEAQGQVRLLTSALQLLKTVLSSQGPQQEEKEKGQPVDDTKSDQTDDKTPGKNAKKKTRKKNAQAAQSAATDETAGAGSPVKSPASAQTTKETAATKKKTITATSKSGEDPVDLDSPQNKPYQVNKVNSLKLELKPVEENVRPVPRLHYGLDRALFNPGVYHLQDPRSRVFNFDPYLATIMPLQEFDFNALKQYVTSSKDSTLISMAAKHRMKYSGSTSSMTSMLSHFHFLLSGWRPINAAHTSRSFTPESMNFTRIMRGPAATFLHLKDGTYAIDADKEFDSANILSMLGKSMEKLLTLSKEDFEKYRVTRSHELTEEERNDPESFHYTTFGDFMMRSQLDAYDPRLPGTGMFDLKTRAVVSIRMDARDFHRGLGYEIRNRFGQWESFEREYFDMIRSAFLKYSLQVRMGRMDGIYVAFHNTQRIFGFQYISISEMDVALHGTEDTTLGDREFMLSLHLLNVVLDKATERFPGRSLRLHIETRPSEAAPFMYVFATPVTAAEIAEVQDAGKESVEAFEREILGLATNEARENDEPGSSPGTAAEDADNDIDAKERDEDDEPELDYDEDGTSVDVWETMRQKVEETMENETHGIEAVRDTIEDALEQSGLLRGRSSEETRTYVDALLEAVTRTDTEAVAETILKGQNDAGSEVQAEAEAEVEVEAEGDAIDSAKAKIEAELLDEPTAEEASGAEIVQNSREPAAESETEPTTTLTDPTQETSTLNAAACVSKSIIHEDDGIVLEDGKTTGENDNQLTARPSSSSTSSPGTLSLKDLIIKLAAQVEAAQLRDAASSVRSSQPREEQLTDKDRESESTGSSQTSDAEDYNSTIAELVDAPKNKRFERILSVMMARPKDTKSAAKTSTTSPSSAVPPSPSTPTGDQPQELLGMIMTVRNKVNGRYVIRPEKLTKKDSWTVEYAIEEIQEARARELYKMLKKRRRDLLSRDHGRDGKDTGGKDKKSDAFNREFMNKLYSLSAKGRKFRRSEDQQMSTRPVHVYGVDGGLEWGEVFDMPGEATGKKLQRQASA